MHEANVAATELARSLARLYHNKIARRLFVIVCLFIITIFIFNFFGTKKQFINCAFRMQNSSTNPIIKGDANRVDKCVRLEVVSTNSARTLGLSGREELRQNEGMLFDFYQADEYCMWMKDMKFNIDIMWLNSEKEVIYMIDDVSPKTFPKSFCGPKDARYVAEVNSGVLKSADLQVGQKLRF